MFIPEPAPDPDVTRMLEADVASGGYVMNLTRLWAWRPKVNDAFVAARKQLSGQTSLALRELAVLVCATARSLNDSYCSIAWGTNLARLAGDDTAAEFLRSAAAPALSEREAALADWAKAVVTAPNSTDTDSVNRLRNAGLNDQEIFDATVFVAFRQAFSTVNDALGACPDLQLWEQAPQAVREAVGYGRRPAPTPSS